LTNSLPFDKDNPYNIVLEIKTSFVKVPRDKSILEVKNTDREDAPEVRITEDNAISTRYPLTYDELRYNLRRRYSDFKQDNHFYAIKRDLEDQNKHGEKYCRFRYLNPLSKSGSRRTFYSTEVYKQFDKHYKRK
jgi:hypothetical protein